MDLIIINGKEQEPYKPQPKQEKPQERDKKAPKTEV